MCVRLAVELAGAARVALRVIDLAVPPEDPDLVNRWIGPETILPLLISPGGERLEGPAWFDPTRLRRFYRGR